MTVHDASDGYLHSFAHIARVSIKGKEIGRRVIHVISDALKSVIVKTQKSGVGVCDSDRVGSVTHRLASFNPSEYLNYVCDVASEYSYSQISAVITRVLRELCATFCAMWQSVLLWCSQTIDLTRFTYQSVASLWCVKGAAHGA